MPGRGHVSGLVAVIAPVNGKAGERVIAYIDHVGRLEGTIVRQFQNGFAMTIAATPRKRDKLASQLTWLANRHVLGLPEDRRHGRVVPRDPVTNLVLPDGKAATCRLIDMSLSGAGVTTEERPPIGLLVTLGKTQGRVVRHLDHGFAVEFTRLQHPDLLEENVTNGSTPRRAVSAHSLGFPRTAASAAACCRSSSPPPHR